MALPRADLDALINRLNTTQFGRLAQVTDITIKVKSGQSFELKQSAEGVWSLYVETPEPAVP